MRSRCKYSEPGGLEREGEMGYVYRLSVDLWEERNSADLNVARLMEGREDRKTFVVIDDRHFLHS